MKLILALIIAAVALAGIPEGSAYEEPVNLDVHEAVIEEDQHCVLAPIEPLVEPVDPIVEETIEVEPVIEEAPIIIHKSVTLTDEEIDLIALVTMAEAEGECEEGKRLVIDTILNRVESIYFPNTVYEVVYQPNHFSAMWCDRITKCYVDEDIRQLVIEECKARLDYEVVFFTAGRYGKYGEPMYQVGNHYFSSYD